VKLTLLNSPFTGLKNQKKLWYDGTGMDMKGERAMRLRHKPWAKEKLQQHPEIVIQEPESYAGKWSDSFQQGAPIHVEIGTGKGRFIVESAKQQPDTLFIGIELMESVIVSALDKVLDGEVSNVRLINRHAQELPAFFVENEADRIYLNFSDPWPKNRHEKRRLTYKTYLEIYEKILKPDGEIHLKTDNRGLFEYSLESFKSYGMSVKNVSRNLHQSGMKHNVMTEYEEKFSQKGQPIYRCEAAF
jgi:tRNA (guanine-N7-)-methyltransferase